MEVEAVSVIAGLYSFWIVATLALHCPGRIGELVSSYNFLGMIPRWNFFAPRPGTTDAMLVYRDILHSANMTEWKEIVLSQPRQTYHAIWNPNKRVKKLMIDIMPEFLRELSEYRSTPTYIQISMPYLMFLNAVVGSPHSVDTRATQFAILSADTRHNDGDPAVLFVSAIHAL